VVWALLGVHTTYIFIMKKILSYTIGLSIALLAVAPPLNYNIPTMFNSFGWLYIVVASGLFGMFLFSRDLPVLLKVLSGYLWLSCFFSSAPYLSFNAYILVVASLYFFLGAKHADKKIILNMVTAAFWLQVFIVSTQLLGKDTLLNFTRQGQPVFFGTILQYMRFSSLLAIMAPLLILKSKWYIIPVIVMAVLSHSSAFGLAVIAGIAVYVFLKYKRYRLAVVLIGFFGSIGYVLWDITSFRTAMTCGRIPVWGDVIKSWVMDTSKGPVVHLSGPIDIKSIFFGRGMDTFLPLFPIMKHDPNPFPQAHNMYLQWLWEIGTVGASILLGYCGQVVYRLYRRKEFVYIAGLVIIGVNCLFAFPDRMTQTALMMLCFLAMCEKKIQLEEQHGRKH